MPNSAPIRVTYHGKLFDIPRDFVDNEHPGGADSIYPYEGSDMTEAFEDVGHSKDAVDMLKQWLVDGSEEATISSKPAASKAAEAPAAENNTQPLKASGGNGGLPACIVPWLVAVGCGVVVYIALTRRRAVVSTR